MRYLQHTRIIRIFTIIRLYTKRYCSSYFNESLVFYFFFSRGGQKKSRIIIFHIIYYYYYYTCTYIHNNIIMRRAPFASVTYRVPLFIARTYTCLLNTIAYMDVKCECKFMFRNVKSQSFLSHSPVLMTRTTLVYYILSRQNIANFAVYYIPINEFFFPIIIYHVVHVIFKTLTIHKRLKFNRSFINILV